MAITVLRIKNDNLMFKTRVIHEKQDKRKISKIITLSISVVDDELKPLSKEETKVLLISEKEFHIDLRKTSSEKEQLITGLSTNPEWNPKGYIKNL